MENKTTPGDALGKKDFIIGTIIALVMGTTFTLLSSGKSLLVTFVPGIVITWLTFAWLYKKQIKLPDGPTFFPLFFATLAWQFIHFAEEFTTGFRTKFPFLYGGTPYSDNLFVTFNMLSYFVFTLACILVFTKKLRFLLVPVLFYIIYGAIGNAISHSWWSLSLKSYFPGFASAQLYWVLGPLVLYKLLGERRAVIAVVILFALVLIPLLTIFSSPAAISSF